MVEGSFGQEVGAAGEGFQIKELIFDEAVNGFHIALVGMSGGWDALMLRAEVSDGGGKMRTGTVGLQLPDEFTAVVGLPGEIAQDHATTLQVSLNVLGKQGAGRGRSLGGEGQELQATADVASRVLERR